MNVPLSIIRFLKQYSLDHILTVIKIILALLLIGCLFNASRDYYRIVRYLVFLIAIWVSYVEFNKGGYIAAVASIFVFIIVNPIAPLFIPQAQWIFFYAALAIALVCWAVYEIYLIEVSKEKRLRYRE